MWVYRYENERYEVGYYPHPGTTFYVAKTFKDEGPAARYVSYLNGGRGHWKTLDHIWRDSL